MKKYSNQSNLITDLRNGKLTYHQFVKKPTNKELQELYAMIKQGGFIIITENQ